MNGKITAVYPPGMLPDPNVDPMTLVPDRTRNRCGWCRRDSWLQLRAATWAGVQWFLPYDERDLIAATYECPGCERTSLFVFETVDAGGLRSHVRHVFPSPRSEARGDTPLPADVEADRAEAWNCFHAGHSRAAVVMARAALQRAVRALGARGSLSSELDDLLEHEVITPQLRADADAVGITRSDAAHPEDLRQIDRHDAEDSLLFLDSFLEATFRRSRPARRGERLPGAATRR